MGRRALWDLPDSPHMQHYVDVTGYHEPGAAALRAHAVYFDHVSPGEDMGEFLAEITDGDGALAGVQQATHFELVEI